MLDTRFVSGKPLTFDCDLDLDRGNLIFVRDDLFILLYLSVKFNQIPYIGF